MATTVYSRPPASLSLAPQSIFPRISRASTSAYKETKTGRLARAERAFCLPHHSTRPPPASACVIIAHARARVSLVSKRKQLARATRRDGTTTATASTTAARLFHRGRGSIGYGGRRQQHQVRRHVRAPAAVHEGAAAPGRGVPAAAASGGGDDDDDGEG